MDNVDVAPIVYDMRVGARKRFFGFIKPGLYGALDFMRADRTRDSADARKGGSERADVLFKGGANT